MGKLRKINSRAKEKWFELVGETCPICGSQGWCAINEARNKVICMKSRNEGERVMNGWLYFLDNPANISVKEVVGKDGEKIQTNNILHKVYSLVKDTIGITDADKQHLITVRGLTESQIDLRGYFSTDLDSLKKQVVGKSTIWEELFEKNGLPKDAWKGVPGFYLDIKHGCPVFETKPGIAIPCRNQFGQIIRLQLRVDESYIKVWAKVNKSQFKVTVTKSGSQWSYKVTDIKEMETVAEGKTDKKEVHLDNLGVSFKIKTSPKYLFVSSVKNPKGTAATSEVHYAFSDEILAKASFDENGFGKVNLFNLISAKNVLLTEGLLKSDIIISKMNEGSLSKLKTQVVVAIAGVNVWSKARYNLVKSNVKTLFSAFDQDFVENDAVLYNMRDMIADFKKHSIPTFAITWEVGKGLDDCLLSDVPDSDRGYNLYQY